MIRLILSDLDGTMFQEGSRDINPRYFDVIGELTRRGIIFGVATGRQLESLRTLFEPVKDDILYITEGGAYAVYQGRELAYKPMTLEDSHGLVTDTRKMEGCQSMYDTKNISYYEKGGEEVYDLMKNHWGYRCKIVDDLLEVKEPCIKYSVYRTTDIEEVTADEFNPKWSKKLHVACAGHNFMDAVRMDANKGSTLAEIQEILNISKEETMVFGDNINDLRMMDQAKFSFAIGNAKEEVKKEAAYVADTCKNDGVLKVLEQVLACSRD